MYEDDMTTGKRAIRFGVLGCGSIAQKAMLPALASSPRARLVAVASRSEEKAKRCAAGFDCEAATDYQDLLQRDDIEAVYIALPVGLHAQWALEAARNRKSVLCEKTLAATLHETRQIISACETASVALMEGFTYQFHPQHRAVRELVAAGGIGDPVLFQSWLGFPPIDSPHRYDPALGGGALLDAGTYTIHGARRFFGTEPEVLSAVLENGDTGVDIYGSVHLKFGERLTAMTAFGFNYMYRNSYAIWGTEGSVTLTRAFSIPAHFAPTMIVERQGCREERTLSPADQFRLEVEAFCDGMEDEAQRRGWAADALDQAIALDRVRSSHERLRDGKRRNDPAARATSHISSV
jgi:predicted dehydrogenase